jgi:hypothetical protein
VFTSPHVGQDFTAGSLRIVKPEPVLSDI